QLRQLPALRPHLAPQPNHPTSQPLPPTRPVQPRLQGAPARMSTYDVRVYALLVNENTRKNTYTVRWKVAGKSFRDTFATKALAEHFRSKLVVAQREGVAFDEATGLPGPMARAHNARSWYDHAIAFVDMKWPRA